MDSNTEPSSLFMQTEQDVKEPDSALVRGVLCAQGPRRERRVSKRLNAKFASSCSCTDKYIQNYVKKSWSILEKTVGYVLSESKQLINRMCIIILDALSLKVTAPNLLAAVGVLNVNPRK